MSVNSILDPFIPFIKLSVNGIFAFVILKVVARYSIRSMISNILFILPIYTIFILIINIICFTILKIPFTTVFSSLDPFNAIYALVVYFYILFGLFGWYLGAYFLITEHPKIKIHGYIMAALLILYIFSGNLLHL